MLLWLLDGRQLDVRAGLGGRFAVERVHDGGQAVELLLEEANGGIEALKLLRLLEGVATAVCSVLTVKVEAAAALAGRLAIALDLATLAFVAARIGLGKGFESIN
jgi:hypothetical protein